MGQELKLEKGPEQEPVHQEQDQERKQTLVLLIIFFLFSMQEEKKQYILVLGRGPVFSEDKIKRPAITTGHTILNLPLLSHPASHYPEGWRDFEEEKNVTHCMLCQIVVGPQFQKQFCPFWKIKMNIKQKKFKFSFCRLFFDVLGSCLQV